MDILQEIIEFINKEADARMSKQNSLLALPLKDRLRKGDALTSIVEVDIKSIIPRAEYVHFKAVAWQYNNSRFKVGDYVKIHKGDINNLDEVYSATIEFEGINFFILRVGFNARFFKNEQNTIWVLERDTPDLRKFFIDAIFSFTDQTKKNKIIDIINGITLPHYELNKIKEAIHISRRLPFNRSQKKAFIRAYATNDFSLIQGPPGTGKTWLLAHLAILLAKKGQKILITSSTHRAINNALLKIRSISDYGNVIKVGPHYHEGNLEKHQIKCYENLEESYIKDWKVNGMIVGGSPYSLHSRRLKLVDFDTIIFDEASQMNISHTLTSMIKGNKYVFVGDHKQMPPIYNAEHESSILNKSLFENLINIKNVSTMLNITYRMNDEINKFSSRIFYNNNLFSDSSVKYSRIVLEESEDVNMQLILNPKDPSVAISVNHYDNQMKSDEEANVIVLILIELLKLKFNPKEIGVLTPYRAQARQITTYLKDAVSDNYSKLANDIMIDTVERMQGQEKEIVLISMASSDYDFINDNIEFLFDPNRFNVAITRAKNKRIFICSQKLLETKSEKYQNKIDYFNMLFKESLYINLNYQ